MTPNTRRLGVASLALLLTLGACDDDGGEDAGSDTTETATGGDSAPGDVLQVTVSPDQVVPGPGAEGASGSFEVTIDEADRVICTEGTVDGLDQAGPTHLVLAPAGQPGPIMAELVNPVSTSTSGQGSTSVPPTSNCVETRPAQVFDQLLERPWDFAIVVRSPGYPEGALRGQLAEAPADETTTTVPGPAGTPVTPTTSG